MLSVQKVACQSGKQRSVEAASYALCIRVERSHRQRLLHKQEGSDGVVGGGSEVSLGHGHQSGHFYALIDFSQCC